MPGNFSIYLIIYGIQKISQTDADVFEGMVECDEVYIGDHIVCQVLVQLLYQNPIYNLFLVLLLFELL